MSNIFSGKLIIIVGPSGVGKGTAINTLKKRHSDWVFPISATTRKKRPREKDGETYHFFSKKLFDQKIEENEFVEWACVHGENKYGTLKSEIFPALEKGKIILREVDIQGFESIRNMIPKKHFLSVFLLPPPQEILIQRIKSRSPISEEELKKRLKSMEKEMALAKDCDIQIQTRDGDFEHSVREIEKAIEEFQPEEQVSNS